MPVDGRRHRGGAAAGRAGVGPIRLGMTRQRVQQVLGRTLRDDPIQAEPDGRCTRTESGAFPSFIFESDPLVFTQEVVVGGANPDPRVDLVLLRQGGMCPRSRT